MYKVVFDAQAEFGDSTHYATQDGSKINEDFAEKVFNKIEKMFENLEDDIEDELDESNDKSFCKIFQTFISIPQYSSFLYKNILI